MTGRCGIGRCDGMGRGSVLLVRMVIVGDGGRNGGNLCLWLFLGDDGTGIRCDGPLLLREGGLRD